MFVLLFGHFGQTCYDVLKKLSTCEHSFKCIRAQSDLVSIDPENVLMAIADLNDQYPDDIQLFREAYASLIEKLENPGEICGPDVLMTYPLASDGRMTARTHQILTDISRSLRGKYSFIGISADHAELEQTTLTHEILNLLDICQGVVNFDSNDYYMLGNHCCGRIFASQAADLNTAAQMLLDGKDLKQATKVLLSIAVNQEATLGDIAEAAEDVENALSDDCLLVWGHRITECDAQIALITFTDFE